MWFYFLYRGSGCGSIFCTKVCVAYAFPPTAFVVLGVAVGGADLLLAALGEIALRAFLSFGFLLQLSFFVVAALGQIALRAFLSFCLRWAILCLRCGGRHIPVNGSGFFGGLRDLSCSCAHCLLSFVLRYAGLSRVSLLALFGCGFGDCARL